MNRKIFAIAAAVMMFTAVYGQQSLKNDMINIAHALALETELPGIEGLMGEPDKVESHYIKYTIRHEDCETIDFQIYRYPRPAAVTDRILVAYNFCFLSAGAWLKCFMYDRKTGTLTAAELPFELLSISMFDKEKFEEDHGYFVSFNSFLENGNVKITAKPGMSWNCVMLARYNGNDSFTLFRRAGYDYVGTEIAPDNAETEQYVQNVVRPNFQRINAIKKWEYVEERKDINVLESSATLTYYYSASGLEKMVARLSSENSNSVVEYFFLDGKLSFIYDLTTITNTNTKTERRWYLKGESVFRGIGNNGVKLTAAEIEAEFLGENGWGGAFNLYQTIVEL